jgi:hypothetical protein
MMVNESLLEYVNQTLQIYIITGSLTNFYALTHAVSTIFMECRRVVLLNPMKSM